ncbi:maestro heat-like repeat-containing protein family member 1 [Heterodontus francisci]|uniref:maestro heat-like repeat-containing protein family member 1 n=1 Tax=Heterodontus francisci TaxID=7792 RepID=UPI00355AFE7E
MPHLVEVPQGSAVDFGEIPASRNVPEDKGKSIKESTPTVRRRGNQQYPEVSSIGMTHQSTEKAASLKKITAKVVIEKLAQFFTRYGFPKEILSNQEPNFMPGIFQEVMCNLGMKQFKSSVYHPQSQGEMFCTAERNYHAGLCVKAPRKACAVAREHLKASQRPVRRQKKFRKSTDNKNKVNIISKELKTLSQKCINHQQKKFYIKGQEKYLSSTKMVMNRLQCSLSMIMNLLSDHNEFVKLRFSQSLRKLGCINHQLVLTFCHKYITKNKLPAEQHTALLMAITCIIQDNIEDLDKSLAKKLIKLALKDTTGSEHVMNEHREAASSLVVSLGAKFPIDIFNKIQSVFKSRPQTYFYMVLTMARLCRANVYCTVPLLKPVFKTMLLMLPKVTDGEMKWAFCVALGVFSESILEYLSNTEETPKQRLNKKILHKISDAYDLLFNFWLPMKEPKVSIAVMETVDPIIHLLPHDKLKKELPNLITNILSMYQGTCPDPRVTKGLCSVLRTALELNSEVIVTQLQSLQNSLHKHICIVMEQPINPSSEKQLYEILCCFRVLAPAFTDQILDFLQMQLAIDNDQVQLGTLVVLIYLIENVPSNMESGKNQIMTSLQRSFSSESNRVKGLLAKLLYTMASHNYLELEGGKEMVEFIIQQCALPMEENENREIKEQLRNYLVDVVTDNDLRRLYETLIKKLTTTLTIDNVLWEYLLEFVMTIKYTEAFTTVCNVLVNLGRKKLNAEMTEFVLMSEDHPNLPNPRTLFTRLLTVSSSLYQGKDRGAAALNLLHILGKNIHPAAMRVWDKELPTLVDFLWENSEHSNLQNDWEEKLLVLLSQTLDAIAEETWIIQLIVEMTKQVHMYHLSPLEKGFLYKCLGRALQMTQDKVIVKKSLKEMIQSVQQNEDAERDGVASGIGNCALTHLDTTLSVLKDFTNLKTSKTTSIFHLIKNQGDDEIIKVKSMLILCYGQIISHCPGDLILPRIETEILLNVLSNYNLKIFGHKVEVKDLTLKLNLIKAVMLLANVIHPNEEHTSYTLTRKAELLSCMQELIMAEPTETLTTSVQKSAIDACTSLLKLEPSFDVNSELITVCVNSVFNLPALEPCSVNESTNMDIVERQKLYSETLASLQQFLKQCLVLDLSPDGLQALFKNMETGIQSTKEHDRETAMETTLQLVTFYLNNFDMSKKVPSHDVVTIIGCVTLQCADPSHVVRESAIKSLYVLVYIQLHLEGFPMGHQDKEVEHLKTIKVGLNELSDQAFFQTCTDVGNVLSKHIANDQLDTLLFTIFNGLTDKQWNVSYAASIVTNVLIKKRGASLADIPGTIKVLYSHLHSITEPRVTRAVTYSISILASHNVPAVLSTLLTYPVPFDRHISSIWKSLLRGKTLATATIKYLLDNLKSLYDGSSDSHAKSAKGSATQQRLVGLCALREVVCDPDSGQVINSLYPQLVSNLLIHLSFSVWVRFPTNFLNISKNRTTCSPSLKLNEADACHYAAEILQAVVTKGNGDAANMREMEGWDLIISPRKHHEGVTLLASTLTVCAAPQLSSIVEELTPFLVSTGTSQRITIAAFFGELLKHSVVSDLLLMDTLLESLVQCLIDESPIVQWLALVGLGNAAIGASQKIDKYSIKLLSIMISIIDQTSRPKNLIAVEAMSNISKILDQRQNYENPILGNVAIVIQPYLDHQHEKVRAAAFNVLRKLIIFRAVEINTPFMEDIKSTFFSLLLHLNDENIEVVKICKSSLKFFGARMESENIDKMFRDLSFEETTLDYEEYLNNVSKHIGKDLPNQVTFYINSCAVFIRNVLPEIRSNAVTFLGFLMDNAPPDYYRSPAADQICDDVIALLSDPVQHVRMKAAKAIRYLCMY